MDTRSNHFD